MKQMRKKDWSHELTLAFAAPAPKRKEAFLKTMPVPQLDPLGFFFTQLQYVRETYLDFFHFILLVCIGIVRFASDGVCWKTAALLPFLTLITTTEFARSTQWNMVELEIAKYSLSQILMARFPHFRNGRFPYFRRYYRNCQHTVRILSAQTVLYLITPRTMTAALSLWIIRRTPRNESIYLCRRVCFYQYRA